MATAFFVLSLFDIFFPEIGLKIFDIAIAIKTQEKLKSRARARARSALSEQLQCAAVSIPLSKAERGRRGIIGDFS
jgi:hypothetical protein